MLKGRKASPGVAVGEVLIINNEDIKVEKKIVAPLLLRVH